MSYVFCTSLLVLAQLSVDSRKQGHTIMTERNPAVTKTNTYRRNRIDIIMVCKVEFKITRIMYTLINIQLDGGASTRGSGRNLRPLAKEK